MQVNSALSLLTDYPFQRLRDLLDPHAIQPGLEPLSMSIGEPQHQPPLLLQEAINENSHLWNKYPPIAGNETLKTSMKNFLDRRYHLKGLIDTDHILPACGTREALFMVGNLLIERHQKPLVLLPNPFYQVYVGAAVMNEATPVYLPAGPENGFMPDLDAVDGSTWQQTAMLFLCSPGNPQGMSASFDYLLKALELARRYDFVLILDECYAELYDFERPTGALEAAQSSGSLKNLLVFHSLSKRSNAAGLRSGFMAGDPELIKGFLALRNYAGATMPLPLQAASAALWDDDDHVAQNRALYRQKFDAAQKYLGHKPGFYRPNGGFFMWMDVSDTFKNGEEAALTLWREAGVRVLPGAYLAKTDETGQNPGEAFIRVALVHEQSIIETALERMAGVL